MTLIASDFSSLSLAPTTLALSVETRRSRCREPSLFQTTAHEERRTILNRPPLFIWLLYFVSNAYNRERSVTYRMPLAMVGVL